MSEVMVIRNKDRTTKHLCGALFLIWGALGLFLMITEFVRVTSNKTRIGVGSSSFVAMEALIWMGGMMFFGFLGLLAQPAMSVIRHQPRK